MFLASGKIHTFITLYFSIQYNSSHAWIFTILPPSESMFSIICASWDYKSMTNEFSRLITSASTWTPEFTPPKYSHHISEISRPRPCLEQGKRVSKDPLIGVFAEIRADIRWQPSYQIKITQYFLLLVATVWGKCGGGWVRNDCERNLHDE